ncbi:hypothetical protein [Enterobacter phage 04_vB_Eclo_IJM]|nr:hypothetical protein [Enterobacter phage 02_vB_Eclo_IJM]UZT50501.1 hypothetical protein [Enterobacter phage 04_vB_Eclo_IJM]
MHEYALCKSVHNARNSMYSLGKSYTLTIGKTPGYL